MFGHEVGKSDAGHHGFTYSFDAAGRQVETVISTGGDSLTSWYNSGLIASTTDGTLSGSTFTPGAVSTYGYDADGNRTREIYSVAGVGKQNATVAWDAMNRVTSFTDTGQSGVNDSATITYEYDQDSNIRRMAATYYVLDGQGNFSTTTASQEDWYRYDSMNRFVTTKGMLSGTDGNGVAQTGGNARGFGTISRGAAGTDISYDAAGERVMATHQAQLSAPVWKYTSSQGIVQGYYTQREDFDGGTWSQVDYQYSGDEQETYSYSADGYLASVGIAQSRLQARGSVTVGAIGAAVNRAAYTRDAMGRVTDYREYGSDGSTTTYERQDSFDARSNLTDETTTSLIGSDTYVTTAHDDYGAYNGTTGKYDGAYQGGVVTHSTSNTTRNGAFSASDDTVNTFTWWDDAEQASTAVATHYPGGGNDTDYTSTYSYDALGNLTTVSIQDGRPRTVSFLTNAEGEIIQRDEADANASTGDPRQVYYFFEGTRVGDISNDGTSDTDYATSIARHNTAAPTSPGPFRNGAATGTSYADFDQSYDPINGLDYDSTAGTYTVADGDTLESIAQTVWGDASLWYMLADANGLDGTETLVSGRDLVILNKIANIHNNASTYKVYDPNEAIGNTSPTDPKPSKHHSNHCGAFGQILLVAIAVAVTVVTSGAAAAAAAGLNSISAGLTALATVGVAGTAGASLTAGMAIGIGAGAAALGSVVSQGVGIAAGIQDNFSFTGVALSAIAGGVGAGIGSSIGNIGGSPFLGHVVTGALGDAATQGIALATGLQSHFSWSEIAAAGLADGVGDAVGHDIFHVAAGARPNFGQTLVEGAAGAIAGAAERSLLTGSDFGDNIMRTLPSVLGQTIGNSVAREIGGNDQPQTSMQRLRSEGGVEYASAGESDSPSDIIVTARTHGFGWKIADALGLHSNFVHGVEYEVSSLVASAVATTERGLQFDNGVIHGLYNVGTNMVKGAYHLVTTNPATTLKATGFALANGVDSILASEDTPARIQLQNAANSLSSASAYDIGYGVGNGLGNVALVAAPAFVAGRVGAVGEIDTLETAAPSIEPQFEVNSLQVATDAHDLFAQGVADGSIPLDPKLPYNLQAGNFVDERVRLSNLDMADTLGLGSDKIQINKRLYTPDGTYSVPDIYFPQSGNIIDYSYQFKTLNTPQIQRFISASPNGTITIVPPVQIRPVYTLRP